MKIGFVYDAVFPETIGGVEKRIFEIGIRLVRKGHEVHLFGMKYWDGPDTIQRNGLVIHGVMPSYPLYTNGRRKILPAIWYALRLFFPLLQNRVDILECQNFPYFSCFSAAFISRIRRIPLVVVWHEFWGDYWYDYIGRAGVMGKLIERLCLSLSPSLLVDATTVRDAMLQTGLSVSPVLIPCGTDRSSIAEIPASPVQSHVIFVGRFIPEKHPEILVSAISRLKGKIPDLYAVFIGDGPMMKEVKSQVMNLGLLSHVLMPGFVADHAEVISYMKSSRVCVLPSEREGFGIVGIEAILCNLFFVTSNHPRNAAQDLVRPWNGVVCDISPESVADAISTCLQRYGTSQEYADERRDFCYRHEWDTIAEQVEEYYTTVLSLH